MPVLDMSIEKLREYKGTSPCPTDFDEFWDERLKELYEIDPKPQLIESDFQTSYAKCYDLYFFGTKGAKVHAKYLCPKNVSGKAPAILKFHGYGGSCGDWTDHLSYVAEGFCVAALDCRGQKGLSQMVESVVGNAKDNYFLRGIEGEVKDMPYVQVILDTAMLARVVMSFDEVDETRMGASGSSQGGALTIACAGLVPEIKMASSSLPFLSDFKRVWDMDLDKKAYKEIHEYFRAYDPLHEKEDEFFYKLGYIDMKNMARRVKANTLVSTGLLDNICPPSTQFAVYNNLNCEKTHHIYPDFGHEQLTGFGSRVYKFFIKLKTL